jgi:hypothetical protein
MNFAYIAISIRNFNRKAGNRLIADWFVENMNLDVTSYFEGSTLMVVRCPPNFTEDYLKLCNE